MAGAAGLGPFTAWGTQMALSQGMPAIVAVLMGVITAVFGGMLRDIVCNEITSAFRDPPTLCDLFLRRRLVPGGRADTAGTRVGRVLGAAVVAAGLRVWALATGFKLPMWSPEGSPR